MTKDQAIKYLCNSVFNHLQASGFWNDPEYEDEINALLKLKYITKEELKELKG